MKKKHLQLMFVLILSSWMLNAQKTRNFEIKSLDGRITLHVETGPKLQWSVHHRGQQIIEPSDISLQLEGDEVLGDNAIVRSSNTDIVNIEIQAINYKKAIIPDQNNQLTINCRGGYGVIFRVYNDAVAYRFFIEKTAEVIIKNEEANFNFTDDHKAFIPYMWDYRNGKIFNSSFESLYTVHNISQFRRDSLAFLPLMVDLGNGKKVVILEADLENYPGMFLNVNQTKKGFMGVYAPYPLEEEPVGINVIPTKRADYIAKTSGARNFPWRTIVISEQDKELLNNDIVQKLASPSRIEDISWIEPGQVSWDWWNAMNISHVDFRAGKNTATYKYFIDFASANHVRYIIIDGGCSVSNDLMNVIPRLDLEEIIDYGKQKGVGVILWATWYAITEQMEAAFPFYSKMG